MLNQKFSQHRHKDGHWIASRRIPDVETLDRERDTLWSAPPDNYGFAEYVQGWAALARDLSRAAVPYAVHLSPWALLPPHHDLASTPDQDEGALINQAVYGAKLALLASARGALPQRLESAAEALRSAGVRVVIAGPAGSDCR